MFKVGQKVVCIQDPTVPGCIRKSDRVYTVARSFFYMGYEHIVLAEYVTGGELAHRFRPVDDLFDQIERIEKEGLPAELLEEVADYMELCDN